MEMPQLVEGLEVETFKLSPSLKPPGSSNTLFLAGAGVRGLQIQDNFIKFTAIGVYLEQQAIPSLAVKWKGLSAQELTDSDDFFKDIVTGPYEKFTMITMILPLTGEQYSSKVIENCVVNWKAVGIYNEVQEKAAHKFLEVFKDEKFAPGSSILFTQSPKGTLTIAFSKDGSIPEEGVAEIENKPLSQAILYSIVGENGVSPKAKQSLAERLSHLLMKTEENSAS